MTAKVYFVVNIDSDPDPENTPPNNDAVMEKYRITKEILDDHAGGKGTICIHTSPMYRDRFFREPFMEFWKSWVDGGGELTLHPEEDLYSTPETRLESGTYYNDIEHMDPILRAQARFMEDNNLPFAAYKGGYHGLTKNIVHVLKKIKINIDLTCAPGIHWPEKAAHWAEAPLEAFYMSSEACWKKAQKGEESSMFEIPFGWDGQRRDASPNRLLDEHYLVNEFSNYEALCRVWDTIVDRAAKADSPQIVSILCHTYAMKDNELSGRCANILDYMTRHEGVPVTAREAKKIYDEM